MFTSNASVGRFARVNISFFCGKVSLNKHSATITNAWKLDYFNNQILHNCKANEIVSVVPKVGFPSSIFTRLVSDYNQFGC